MKSILVLLFTFFAAASVNAQLANSKWRGTLQLDNPVEVIFDFGKDSLKCVVAADNSELETMNFSVKDSVLTLKKLYGQSNCDTAEGKYKFAVKDTELTLWVMEDACTDRSSVLDNTKWKKE